MENLVNQFLALQAKVNLQINTYGEANHDDADELERIGDMLTPEQIDYLIDIIR